MESTICNSTSLPASIRNVHRARPWGAGPQQVATSFASATPSSLRKRRRAILFLPAERGLHPFFHPPSANIENGLGSNAQGFRDFGVLVPRRLYLGPP